MNLQLAVTLVVALIVSSPPVKKLYIEPSGDETVKNVEVCLSEKLSTMGFAIVSKDDAEGLVRVRKVETKFGLTKVPEVWMKVTDPADHLIWEGSKRFKRGKTVWSIGVNKDCSLAESLAKAFTKKVW